MGTVFRFEASAGIPAAARAGALESALDEVDRLERILSNWRSESELSRLNRSARRRATHVSSDLFEAVERALYWARETEGAFDPTVEPLTRRFRQGPSQGNPASSADWRAGHGNWRDVSLNRRSRTIRFRRGVRGLDLGGIAKGFALDRAAAVLRRQGMNAFLLDAGGQVLAAGAPAGMRGWPVAVADPARRDRPFLPLLLSDVSAATSGNAERPGEIVDPATGAALRWKGSATAVAPDATSADALSTALFVLGSERGTRWTRRRHDVAAVFLDPGDRGPTRISGTVPESEVRRRPIEFFSTTDHEGRILHVSFR
jgi:thiamine biosynthesis lipoprotein